MDSNDIHDIDAAIKEIVDTLHPDARYLPKYGGEVIAPDPDSDKTFVGGIYAYDGYVSLELSKGATFDDPSARLEGKGKARRHLKFQSAQEVTDKDAAFYLRQALADYL